MTIVATSETAGALALAQSVSTAAYIVAALLFILALAGLSKQETARRGVVYGIVGMTIALLATLVLVVANGTLASEGATAALGIGLLVAAVLVGGAIGLWRARVVEMTGMPELIACCTPSSASRPCSSAGTAASTPKGCRRKLVGIHHAEVFIGVFIGAVTFTGSIVAFLKLSGRMSSKPLMLPGKNASTSAPWHCSSF